MKALLLIAALLAQGLQFQGSPGIVTGRLLTKEGSPAQGVRVSAMVPPDANVPATLVSSAETDAAGRYRLENIPPGRYYITAGFIEQPTYYPGVAALSGATAIEVSAGRTISDINFTMAISAGVVVRGRVALPPAQPSLLVQRISMNSPGNLPLEAVLKPDGGFEFTKVRPGTYTLMVMAPGTLNQPLSIAVGNEDVTGILVPLSPTILIAGTVVVEGGGLRPRFQISFASFKGTGPQTPAATPGPNGEFRTPVPEGDYRISWGGLPQGYFLKSITAGSTDLLANPLTVVAGRPPISIVVTLGVVTPAPWVKVAGRVTRPAGSQTPLPKTVGLMGTSLIDVLEAPINSDGSFAFPMVLPGTYLSRMTPMPPMSPKQIIIPGKDTSNIEIPIPPTKDVPGRVTIEGNAPPPRLVFTMSDTTGSFSASAVPESDGTFRVTLPEGERRTNLTAPGFSVKAFSYGAANLLRDPLRISAADSAEFSIALSFPGAQSTTSTPFGTTTAGTAAGILTFSNVSPPALPAVPAPPSAAVVRVTNDVAAANLLSRIDPQYPDAARAARISGVVVLSVEIGRDGKVESLSVVTGHPLLIQAAIDAVRQWRYQPIIINNQPTAVVTTVTVSFQVQ